MQNMEMQYSQHHIIHPLAFEDEETPIEEVQHNDKNAQANILTYLVVIVLAILSGLFGIRRIYDYIQIDRRSLGQYCRRFKRLIGIRR